MIRAAFIDYIVIVVYFLLILGFGAWFARLPNLQKIFLWRKSILVVADSHELCGYSRGIL